VRVRLGIATDGNLAMKEEIGAVAVSLKIADSMALFILMAAEGTVNRSGTGAINNSEHDLFIGLSQDRLFQRFMDGVDEDIFQHTGSYVYPEPKGQLCTLTLSFQVPPGADGRDNVGFEFVYGSESEGPNRQINQMVREAVRLTEPWYEQQKQMVKKAHNSPAQAAPMRKASRFLGKLFRPK